MDKKQMDIIKKVLRYMKKYIPLLAVSILLAMVTVAMTLYFPILVGNALDLIVEKGKLVVKDITRPYGFVDLNAKVWFQRFLDDGLYEREYLMTEGYLWTGQYPEAQRIIDKGNNQSMELEEKFTSGSWTKDEKGNAQFFIINETIISKLCILGEDTEPCFEGASVTRPIVQFTLDINFNET